MSSPSDSNDHDPQPDAVEAPDESGALTIPEYYVLYLPFNDLDAPFEDQSSRAQVVTNHAFIEDGLVGVGVQWDKVAPSPAGGGYAMFDGASYLEIMPSDDFLFRQDHDFTISFWFRSAGIKRSDAYGRYRERMEPLNMGTIDDNTNFRVNMDDVDGGGIGLSTYWIGGGQNRLWTGPGTMGMFTDNRWYRYWLVRDQGVMTLYAGWADCRYLMIDSVTDPSKLSNATSPVIIGRSEHGTLGFKGAIDDVRIVHTALHPLDGDCGDEYL